MHRWTLFDAYHIMVNHAQEIIERLDSICGAPQDLAQGGNFVMVLQNSVKTMKAIKGLLEWNGSCKPCLPYTAVTGRMQIYSM